MLSEITLSNFKCFKETTTFPLANINLLTGINGRGKSSVLQALLLMKQSVDINEKTEQVYLNGNCVDLGSIKDVKNTHTLIEEPIILTFKSNIAAFKGVFLQASYEFSTNEITKSDGVSIPVNLNDRQLLIKKIRFNSNAEFSIHFGDNYPVIDKENMSHTHCLDLIENRLQNKHIDLRLPLHLVFENLMPLFLFDIKNRPAQLHYYLVNFQKIHYISADRIGPQNFYQYTNTSKFITVDKQGKYAPFILFKKREESVYEPLCLGQDAKTVEQQTEEWLSHILDGAKISIKGENETIGIEYNSGYKPSNVGFGYSYILPIIISGLIAKKGEILIVENPEAHLHPKAQSKLTKFLAKVAACGVQIFIESHSEHILNALRVVSINKEFAITNSDISVLYFQDDEQKLVIPIPINANGSIEFWPESFFDQEEKDLSEIFRLTRKK
jgi:predicted ATPase